MTSPRAGPSRGASVARTILKRREKPYKTERSRVLAKKKRLDIRITTQIIDRAGKVVVPQGFRFLPVGTPQLANRCRELSRSKGLPVNVVNAKPSNTHGEDPGKISFHIRRIGYHFRAEVVDQACRELSIVLNDGKFIKEDDLREEFQNTTMARAMAKLGLRLDVPAEQKETHDQIRLAIQELFPKIPEEDLEAVIKISWEEGSDKIGMHQEVSLARRIQLAVIARIRHVYTDYDQLLAAFKDWQFARASVEKECLEKLIEWRGENDNDAADDELEEIIRETIVIDDDDDVGSDADGDSVVELDSGDASDTSLEISYTRANEEDLRPESVHEFQRQRPSYQPIGRDDAQFHSMDIRQKIGFVRQQKRDERSFNTTFTHGKDLYDLQQERRMHDQGFLRVNVNEDHRHANTIVVGGQVYKKLNPPAMTEIVDLTGEQPIVRQDINHSLNFDQTHRQHPSSNVQAPLYAYRTAHSNPSSPRAYNTPRIGSAGEAPLRDRPIPSIERPEELYRTVLSSRVPELDNPHYNVHRYQALTPDRGHLDKRRRLAEPTSPGLAPEIMQGVQQPPVHPNYAHFASAQQNSPANIPGLRRVSPLGHRGHYINEQEQHRDMARLHVDQQGGLLGSIRHAAGPPAGAGRNASYDPLHPLISVDEQANLVNDLTSRQRLLQSYEPTDSQVAPIQYLSREHARQSNAAHSRPYRHQPSSVRTVVDPLGHRLMYVEAPREGRTPLPMHGAPAFIQQMPKSEQSWQPVFVTRATQSTTTAGHPATSSETKALSSRQVYYT